MYDSFVGNIKKPLFMKSAVATHFRLARHGNRQLTAVAVFAAQGI
jgi:hypothetical protein